MTVMSSTYAWRKRWRLDHERGLTRTVDAGPTAERLRALADAGWSIGAIADAAGLSRTALHGIYRGDQNRVARTTETAVLAVKMRDLIARSNRRNFVPKVGTQRRIQALLAIGWTHQDLRERSGLITAVLVSQGGKWVSRGNHDRIVALYEELWDVPGPSDITRRRSARLGYVPPQTWGDDEIDDPLAKPHLLPDKKIRSGDELVAEARLLADQPLDVAARRIGVSPSALEAALIRAGHNGLVHRLRANNPPRSTRKEWSA